MCLMTRCSRVRSLPGRRRTANRRMSPRPMRRLRRRRQQPSPRPCGAGVDRCSALHHPDVVVAGVWSCSSVLGAVVTLSSPRRTHEVVKTLRKVGQERLKMPPNMFETNPSRPRTRHDHISPHARHRGQTLGTGPYPAPSNRGLPRSLGEGCTYGSRRRDRHGSLTDTRVR